MSPTIGTLLMVALVVILAASIIAIMLSYGNLDSLKTTAETQIFRAP